MYSNRRNHEVNILTEELKYFRACSQENEFKKVFIDNVIGYGVFTIREFKAGDPLLEYKGNLITRKEAKELSKSYSAKNKGCFIFDVYWNNKNMSIDATQSTCMAKFINDSPDKYANCQPKTCVVNGIPHLLLYAKKDIAKDSELRYNYGDSSNQQWRKLAKYQEPFTMSEVNAYLRGQPLQKNRILTASMLFSSFNNKKSELKKDLNSCILSSNQMKINNFKKCKEDLPEKSNKDTISGGLSQAFGFEKCTELEEQYNQALNKSYLSFSNEDILLPDETFLKNSSQIYSLEESACEDNSENLYSNSVNSKKVSPRMIVAARCLTDISKRNDSETNISMFTSETSLTSNEDLPGRSNKDAVSGSLSQVFGFEKCTELEEQYNQALNFSNEDILLPDETFLKNSSQIYSLEESACEDNSENLYSNSVNSKKVSPRMIVAARCLTDISKRNDSESNNLINANETPLITCLEQSADVCNSNNKLLNGLEESTVIDWGCSQHLIFEDSTKMINEDTILADIFHIDNQNNKIQCNRETLTENSSQIY
ncbi:uncharacterized protein LOC124807308 isoform X2 [Hydra vulgaris]|uniref:uncharacterized protein LOC124807308 isoform X2 n=1 Tax=Hydra vulgaris TaxID=6087 RepID=UPI001F5EC90C|nr:uncharacterized protein LOC124807308 isoform X3 [Hydra vulgaris]